MAEVLVLVDHVDGTPKKVTLELLALAKTNFCDARNSATFRPPSPSSLTI